MGSEIFVIPAIFIGLPWIVMHYITRWKTAATLTNEDQDLLEDLYATARRLDDRMDTVERIIRADNPGWKPDRLTGDAEQGDTTYDQIDRMMQERKAR